MYTPPPPAPLAPPKLEGLAFASFGLCVLIVLSRAGFLAAYTMAVGDMGGEFKVEKAPLIIGGVILCFYIWSAVGILRRDPRGYRRLRNMSLVFGVIQAISIIRTYAQISDVGPLFKELFPTLWLLAIPVPIALAVLHLVTALVSHRAEKSLRPADEYLFR